MWVQASTIGHAATQRLQQFAAEAGSPSSTRPCSARRSPPSFALRLARRDAGLALAAASDAGARLGALEATAAQIDRAIDAGHGDGDIAAAVYASLAE